MTDEMRLAEWLRSLAKKGGKGAVDGIDARALGRVAEALDAGREWMRRAWQELNTIRARDGAPEGVSEEWWDELTGALGAMLNNDTVPWMTSAAKALVKPYEARAEKAESERDAALSRADSALDDLLARYPASITEWADAVRAARAALSPPVEYPPEQMA